MEMPYTANCFLSTNTMQQNRGHRPATPAVESVGIRRELIFRKDTRGADPKRAERLYEWSS